jgi:hypothetical protein
MRVLAPICAVFFVTACVSAFHSSEESAAVFANPSAFVGRQVHLCGYIHDTFEDSNIWPTRRAATGDGPGLGLISSRDSPRPGVLHNQTKCIDVEITRSGCGQEMICDWSHFEYAARVRYN